MRQNYTFRNKIRMNPFPFWRKFYFYVESKHLSCLVPKLFSIKLIYILFFSKWLGPQFIFVQIIGKNLFLWKSFDISIYFFISELLVNFYFFKFMLNQDNFEISFWGWLALPSSTDVQDHLCTFYLFILNILFIYLLGVNCFGSMT